MITDMRWIQAVDHRISTALILFLLLLLLGNKARRPAFVLRAGTSLAALCLVSWCIRYTIDTKLAGGGVAQGIGYSFHFFIMSLLYLACYAFCYKASISELIYVDLLALTIFKLSWNTFKVFGFAADMLGIPSIWSRYSVAGSLVSYAVYIFICAIACNILHKVLKSPLSSLSAKPVMWSAIMFLVCQMSLEFCGHVFTADNSQTLFLYYFCALAYTITNYSVLLLVAQSAHYQLDNENMQAFIDNKMRYYQMSHDGIASLQIKCHDLKHQIAAIRSKVDRENFDKYIARLEDSIIEYGTVVECGNEAINIVLTEKNILCSTCGIKFSYIIDGTLFDFMTEMEIYTLFGNALDNALESCGKVREPEKRVISLKAASYGEMIVLHVENFFDEKLTIIDGLPVTTKGGDGHGFGLRSIQGIADKYDGVTSVQADNHIFKLTVLMKPTRA